MRRGRLAIGLVLLVVVIAVVGAVLAVRGAGSGPIVGVVTLNQMPGDMVVDARTHRAFITTFDAAQRTTPFNGRVRVLDTASGRLLRTLDAGLDLTSGAVAVDAAAGHVFVVGNQGVSKVLTLDARSGAIRNTAVVSPFAQLTAVDDNRHRLFVVNSAGPGSITALNVLDTTSGQMLSQTPLLKTSDPLNLDVQPAALAVDERAGRVFVAAITRNLVTSGAMGPSVVDVVSVFDAASGRLLRSVPLGSAPSGTIPSPPALVVDERRGHVVALDPTTASVVVLDAPSGAVLHRTHLSGGGSGAAPAWALDGRDGRLFISNTGAPAPGGGRSGGVSVLDTGSGRLLRTALSGSHPGALLVDEQTRRVFVQLLAAPGRGGGVAVLDAANGRLLTTTAVGASGVMALDQQRGRVYLLGNGILDHGNRISVLDAGSGRVLRTITLGAQPGQMAVDEANGRLVVLTIGSLAPPDRWSWVPGWLRQRLPFLPAVAPATAGAVSSAVVLDPMR